MPETELETTNAFRHGPDGEPVTVHDLMGRKGVLSAAVRAVVDVYLEGLGLYRERKWTEAIARFEKALAQDGEDGPSRVYIERWRAYLELPPPDDWDGFFTMTSK